MYLLYNILQTYILHVVSLTVECSLKQKSWHFLIPSFAVACLAGDLKISKTIYVILFFKSSHCFYYVVENVSTKIGLDFVCPNYTFKCIYMLIEDKDIRTTICNII